MKPLHNPVSESVAELLDGDSLSFAETLRALADLDRVNGLLFGGRAVVRSFLALMQGQTGRYRLLDVGTGSGMVSAKVAQKAARQGVRLDVVGVDRKLRHLVIGRSQGVRQLRVVADALHLPFSSGSFDWTVSNLLLHHLSGGGRSQGVGELVRVARRTAVVVDLHRSRWTLWLARYLLPLVGIGRVAYQDGLTSVARSSTHRELAEEFKNWKVVRLERCFPCRIVLVLQGGVPPPNEQPSRGEACQQGEDPRQ